MSEQLQAQTSRYQVFRCFSLSGETWTSSLFTVNRRLALTPRTNVWRWTSKSSGCFGVWRTWSLKEPASIWKLPQPQICHDWTHPHNGNNCGGEGTAWCSGASFLKAQWSEAKEQQFEVIVINNIPVKGEDGVNMLDHSAGGWRSDCVSCLLITSNESFYKCLVKQWHLINSSEDSRG